MPSSDVVFSAEDHAQIAAIGIGEAEVRRQLALLGGPPPHARLVRPCTIGDGIERIPELRHAELLGLADAAARAGRVSKFVPASGAASRMFQSLLAALEKGPEGRADLVAFIDGLPHLPFRRALAQACERLGFSLEDAVRDGSWRKVVRAMTDPEGLGYAGTPKGLIPFHESEREEVRTAFEEHLAEAARASADASRLARVHFTVGPGMRGRFETHLVEARARVESRTGVRVEVSFSEQSPSTDTIAAGEDDQPFRLADGRFHFRPGGHGALLTNLEATGGDLVLVKNVDNVQRGAAAITAARWKRLLVGHLLDLERRMHALARELSRELPTASLLEESVEILSCFVGRTEAVRLARVSGEGWREGLGARLARPVRVAGVVRNAGEPGGGPFWVLSPGGSVTPQIVESSQVDPGSSAQKAIFRSSTHFNPVDLACSLRRADGSPWSLAEFVDPSTSFVATKSKDGRVLKALERPGLWNGAMAGWNTAFVEVPGETFSPVKTVLDLLRPAHQP
jgi:hypothetical protein